MDENRLPAYLQLIQALLSCPSGEEPQILQANSQLLDLGFLQACQAVVATLAEQGEENGANFLRNLASQLEEFLGLTSSGDNDVENHYPNDYLAFLQLLLQTELDNFGGDSRHIYAVLQANLDKLNLKFIPVIQQTMAGILGGINDPEQAKGFAALIKNIASKIQQFPRGSRADNLEIAIAAYEIVLSVRTLETNREGWAQTQNNLANAYYSRIRGERADNIEAAIACYKAALEVRTREAFPENWAMTQNNLAIAYYSRIRGERADNIERAIACYKAALEVRTRQAFPEDWAMTQNNLAAAYKDRIRGERADNIERAIACYEDALEVYTRQAFPENWAGTQNNLAIAYSDRIRGERADNIEGAIACYQAALEVYTREAFPQNHAETLFNLGLAYQESAKLPQADANTQLRLSYRTFARAIDTVESIRGQIVVGGDTAKQKLAEEWNKLYQSMVEVCLDLGEYDRAIGYAERSKARNLVELLANRDLYPKGDIPQPILDELDRLRREIDAEQKRLEIQERTRNSYGGTISEERSPQINTLQTTILNRDRLNQLRQQLDELIARDITPIDSNFRLTQKVEPISYSEIQSLTSENTAILEWYFTGDRFLTFIITPQSPTPIVWQYSSEDVEALGNWRDEYLIDYQTNKTQWRQELADRLESLAEILHIDKLLSHIPPTVDRLVLIPHRLLHLFPLHALQGKRQKINRDTGELYTATGYLIDAPSCQLLQQAQTRQRQEFDRLFAVQNPTNDLDYTDIEVAAIRQHFHPSHILVKNDASKANLEGHIPEPGVAIGDAHCAHFSCHGYFNFENPLLSALLLADCYLEPAPPELDPTRHLRLQNGKALDLGKCLTLADLFALDLGACRLVVLSACETGFSDFNSTSDEYISLLSGLLVAGSPSVVGSLWAVNDLSTALLMMRFYENVKAGLSVAVALKTAQIWLRDAKKEQLQQWTSQQTLDDAAQRMQLRLFLSKIDTDTQPFQSPDYWAAFCAIGQ